MERTIQRQRERAKVPKDTNPINTLVFSILHFEEKGYVSWLSSNVCSPVRAEERDLLKEFDLRPLFVFALFLPFSKTLICGMDSGKSPDPH